MFLIIFYRVFRYKLGNWCMDIYVYVGEKIVLVVWWIIYVFVKDIISVNFVFLYELVVLI